MIFFLTPVAIYNFTPAGKFDLTKKEINLLFTLIRSVSNEINMIYVVPNHFIIAVFIKFAAFKRQLELT